MDAMPGCSGVSGRPKRLTVAQATQLFLALESSSDSDSEDDSTYLPENHGVDDNIVKKKRARYDDTVVDSDSDSDSGSETNNDGTGIIATIPEPDDFRPRTSGNNDGWQWERVADNCPVSTANTFRMSQPSKSGVNSELDLTRDSTPFDVFTRLVDGCIMTFLVDSINDYAKIVIQKHNPPTVRSTFNNWTDTNVAEMYKFLAVFISIGLQNKKSVRDFWSNKDIYYQPWFNTMFTRARFELLFFSMMHVGEAVSVGKDKVEPFVKMMCSNFQKAFYPFEEVAIDEMVIGFKGRFGPLQYNPSKPEKHDIKNYGLCDSSTGYVINLITYYGSDTSYSDSSNSITSHAVKIFDTLLQPLQSGHHIFADRYYTSTDLLEYLTQKRFYYTGTVNLARKNFPAELKKQKLRHRETQFYKSVGSIDALCVAWQDKKAKKPCIMVSTKSTNRIINVQQKRSVVEKPEMVHDYNMMMNGCDRADQMLSYYSVHSRKSMKWWKKVFFWILEIAQINALIIYNATQVTCDQPSKKLSLKKFKETLIDGLVDAATALGDVPRQVKVKTVKADSKIAPGPHLVHYEENDRPCVYCKSQSQRKRTRFFCSGCPSQPRLCVKHCFRLYHEDLAKQ
ncbi:piggyBac transposable element-derived protein 4-like [Biomphalaria glabrata]|uniref:PiggyBac transposable element-derived protein 4-like n=1 Tax=Biomphalaria glabrata TaxID=6526 RepID=A0A9W3BI62_BIOGL|nr:piggyBac transposable element-derived protein 4-like [Biomphalaria glabrata]KAI8771552.1 piggyBac transposable element-derived protein 4 [Biomphalaria glabrata]